MTYKGRNRRNPWSIHRWAPPIGVLAICLSCIVYVVDWVHAVDMNQQKIIDKQQSDEAASAEKTSDYDAQFKALWAAKQCSKP